MATNPTLKSLVSSALKDYGYDGLYNPDGDCACSIDMLMPCGEPLPECVAGYRVDGCDESCGMGCDFHINKDAPAGEGNADGR